MELALTLGATPKPFSFLHKSSQNSTVIGKDLDFCMPALTTDAGADNGANIVAFDGQKGDPPVQLDLLPFSPVHRSHQPSSNNFPFPWLREKLVSEPGKGTDVIRRCEETEEGSSPNSAVSSFPVDFSIFRAGKSDFTAGINEGHDTDMGFSSRGSDDEENGMARKKLRLTKEQSAFLEDSFKVHNTLNPKQKLGLARQLNLRPRQVEVWFQNRRARTKLKQTEVDCEYLKRCCETLTEENKRLQKELQELRALKASHPFYTQLPATTLTMCPSCEKVSTTSAGVAPPPPTATTANGITTNIKTSNFFSLSPSNGHVQQAAS